jgi:hypothetical protein
MPDIWITTTDNPFDFFTQFDDWYQFDESKGYHTCSYVARIAKVSNDLSELDNYIEIARAIEEILNFNLTGNYKLIERN